MADTREGLQAIRDLRHGGATEDQIQGWMDGQRATLRGGGFTEDEIDGYFGVVNPGQADLERAARLAISHAKPADDKSNEFTQDVSTMDALSNAWQNSAMGLLLRGEAPDKALGARVAQSGTATKALSGAASGIIDLPISVVGAVAGGVAGGAVASPTVAGTPVGALVGGGAGAALLPTAIQQVYGEYLENGTVNSWAEFRERILPRIFTTLKATAAGAVAGPVGAKAAGVVAGATASKAASTVAGATADMTANIATLSALDGHLPDFDEFRNASLVMGGTTGAELLMKALFRTYRSTGMRPHEVVGAARTDPTIVQDLAAGDIPQAFAHLVVDVKQDIGGHLEATVRPEAAVEVPGTGGKVEPKLGPSGAEIAPVAPPIELAPGVLPEDLDSLVTRHKVAGDAIVEGPGAVTPKIDWSKPLDTFPEPTLGDVTRGLDDFDPPLGLEPYKAPRINKTGQEGSISLDFTRDLPDVPKELGNPKMAWQGEARDGRRFTTMPSMTAPERTGDATALLDFTSPPGRTFTVRAFDEKGRVVGHLELVNMGGGVAYPRDVHVQQAWRNQGIARALYESAAGYGFKIVRSDTQTEAGAALRDSIGVVGSADPQASKRFWDSISGDATAIHTEAPPARPLGWSAMAGKQRGGIGVVPPKRTADEEAVLAKIGKQSEKEKGPTSLDDVYTAFLDDLHPIRQMERELGGKGQLPAADSPYKQARLLRGVAGKAIHFIRFGTFDFNTYKDNGRPLAEILKPFDADPDGFRAYLAGKRHLELKGRGIDSGMPDAEATAVVKAGSAKYDAAATELVEYQNRVTAYLRDSGIISPELYNAMTQANQAYVPFYRLTDEGGGAKGAGRDVWNPIKAIEGSDKAIADPLESILRNTFTYVSLAEKNAVNVKIADFAAAAGPAGEAYAKKVPAKVAPTEVTEAETAKFLADRGLDPALAEAFTVFRAQREALDENQIAVYRDGKREVYEVDPKLAEALKGTDPYSANFALQMASMPAKWLRAGVTVMPDYMARNILRDQVTAFVFSKEGYIPFVDMALGMGEIGAKGEAWRNFLKGGGLNAAMVSVDRDYLNNEVYKLDPSATKRAWNVVNPLEALRRASEFAENATRVGQMRRATKKYGDDKAGVQEAAYSSREVTQDFLRMGMQMKALNHMTAFLATHVGGLDRAVRAAKDNPVAFTTKTALAITLPSVLLYLANKDEEWYKELPQREKDLYWHFEIGGTHMKVPKPHEVGLMFGSTIERALAAFEADDPRAFSEFATSLQNTLVPDAIPTAALPVLEQVADHSFYTGRNLIPLSLERALPEYQYRPYTTEATKFVAEMVSKVPLVGETSFASPVVIDNYIRQWSGGAGVTAWQLADFGMKQGMEKLGGKKYPTPPTKPIEEMPIVRAFMTRHPSMNARSISDFEARYVKNQRVIDTLSMLEARQNPVAMEKATELRMRHPNFAVDLRDIHAALTNQRNTIWKIHDTPGMDPDEKRQVIDQLTWVMIMTARNGLQKVDAIDEEFKDWVPPEVDFGQDGAETAPR
jgi:GNAT superfamily N-acetyltransferase